MDKKRNNYTAEQKVAILKKYLVDRVALSDICDENGLHPTVFYRWQKAFFENGAAAFQESKTKNEVVSELMEAHIALKKTLGVN